MAKVSLGETVVVTGLGLLGQIAVQLLNATSCHDLPYAISHQLSVICCPEPVVS